jgi:hypothetical protein
MICCSVKHFFIGLCRDSNDPWSATKPGGRGGASKPEGSYRSRRSLKSRAGALMGAVPYSIPFVRWTVNIESRKTSWAATLVTNATHIIRTAVAGAHLPIVGTAFLDSPTWSSGRPNPAGPRETLSQDESSDTAHEVVIVLSARSKPIFTSPPRVQQPPQRP